jgi:hypothetical protein
MKSPTQRLEELLQEAGGTRSREDTMRHLAPRYGVRKTRLTVELALAVGLCHVDYDTDSLVLGPAPTPRGFL